MGSVCCSSEDKVAAAASTTPNTPTRPEDAETPTESKYESDLSSDLTPSVEGDAIKMNLKMTVKDFTFLKAV